MQEGSVVRQNAIHEEGVHPGVWRIGPSVSLQVLGILGGLGVLGVLGCWGFGGVVDFGFGGCWGFGRFGGFGVLRHCSKVRFERNRANG